MSQALAAPRFSPRSILAFLTALAMIAAVAGKAEAAKYAAVVIDANTGTTLYSSSADAERYPASLTKMMTLYMVFEAMKAGKLKKNTQIRFSAQASAKPPTKLGVKAGGSVSVETIIYSLVTKSANDSAAAIAEHLGGSEEGFARMMTKKARQLGMRNTVFRNASGLPNTQQHSTARDMAILGLALREHHPQYYGYFSTRSFAYGKHRMANHNRLLGRVKGVDGIKTGYTRASGFNLVSSVKVGDRSIVAVVMGGQSGRSRDNQMAELIKTYLPKASTRDGGPLVAKAQPSELSASEGPAIAAAMVLPKKGAPKPAERPAVVAEDAPIAAYAPEPAPRALAALDPVKTASVAPSGWVVQVGASPSEAEARGLISKASKSSAGIVTASAGFTTVFEKDGVTYYRARFGGFGSKSEAFSACGALKKRKIDCYAVQQ